MSAAHILVVDADPEVRAPLWRCLEAGGLCRFCGEGRPGNAGFWRPSVSLIDHPGPHSWGGSDRSVPIIIRIGKGGPIDRVAGLARSGPTCDLVRGAEDLSGKAPPFRRSWQSRSWGHAGL